MTLSSRSKILMAYQSCSFSGRSWRQASSIWASACSTGPENSWRGMGDAAFAASMAASAASEIPVPFSAEMDKTGQPSFLERAFLSILSPFFSTTSIILMAMTTGIPSSKS